MAFNRFDKFNKFFLFDKFNRKSDKKKFNKKFVHFYANFDENRAPLMQNSIFDPIDDFSEKVMFYKGVPRQSLGINMFK